jgi:MinD-like ATPase involved in chromosome partitioning or flagellar assembly
MSDPLFADDREESAPQPAAVAAPAAFAPAPTDTGAPDELGDEDLVAGPRPRRLRPALPDADLAEAVEDSPPAPDGRSRQAATPRPILRDEVHHQVPGAWERLTAWLQDLLTSRGQRAEQAEEQRLAVLPAPSRTNLIVFCGPRGGVGKTTTVRTVGGLLARATRGTVVAVDGDQDYGPLADLVPDAARSGRTLTDLLDDFTDPPPPPRLRPYLSALPDGLLVLAAPADTAKMQELTPADYERALELLAGADVVLLDCAGGITKPLPKWALSVADQAVVMTTPDFVAANNIARVLSESEVQLPPRTTLVLNETRPAGPGDRRAIEAHFERHALEQRVAIPYDGELHAMLDRATYRLDELARPTRLPLKALAATIGEGLR